MIPVKARVRQVPHWQQTLAQAITDPVELLQVLGLGLESLPWLQQTASFPLRVPRSFVARMRPQDIHDPLLRQVLPLAAELIPTPGFGVDPVGDLNAQVAPGVIHKYHGRALLIVTGACAVHCRYCFRREFPYAETHAGIRQWQPALDYLSRNTTINEVILSGGDPLALSDRRLEGLLLALAQIPHLKRLRLHSRLPVALPERVDEGLLKVLTQVHLPLILVIHANHPQEIDGAVQSALKQLTGLGITLLNQSVLLRGVNDSASILAALSETLFAAGVLPYYLHLLDRVCGTAHYEVNEIEACDIMKILRQQLPGYLVPRLVREQPEQPAKTPIVEVLSANPA